MEELLRTLGCLGLVAESPGGETRTLGTLGLLMEELWRPSGGT